MKLNYNGLWKKLIDMNMNKTELQRKLKLSPNTISKMTKGENVSLEVLKKIAVELNADIGDLVSLDVNMNGEKHGVK